MFAAALRQALADGEVDLAVHSLKDLPTAPDDRLALAAVPARVDPRDVLVASGGAPSASLPAGSRLGTGSPRRAAQVHALGLGLEVVPVRGNVDTRLRLVADGTVDGVLLARAGLLRLGRADEATEVLDPLQVLPAPGQGALAVECRADDAELIALLAQVDDADARVAVTAERALLGALEAGCTAPVGALAEVVESLDGDGRPLLEPVAPRGRRRARRLGRPAPLARGAARRRPGGCRRRPRPPPGGRAARGRRRRASWPQRPSQHPRPTHRPTRPRSTTTLRSVSRDPHAHQVLGLGDLRRHRPGRPRPADRARRRGDRARRRRRPRPEPAGR
ncbi:hypothetical protein GCM10025868_30750 [Angustibacter aerolatus]|uniref:Hydroxymethylbilane synthase n=1 Tax=Angustibacter aerolatus TaxID=1162965 RepID=A0ABQ6JHW1_9ACTN|nr:hydroxymethylbilane synthase [Angustibacter aerolatus]GMA87825.1 hypothetical protein GCM10025868_30750 [Angustibacter aerolatus]